MYKISEFSKMVGLPKSKIRFYEKHGLFDVKRMENGYRYYTHHDAFRVNAFLVLLQYGFSVKQAVEMLDQKQSGPAFVASLEEQKQALQREIQLLEYRIARIDRTINQIEDEQQGKGGQIILGHMEDYLYVHASHGLDFSASITNAASLEKFYDLLSVSRCSRIIRKEELLGEVEEMSPSYIIAIPETAAYLLGDYNKQHVQRMELGKCIIHSRSKTRRDSVKRESFRDLLQYVREHGLQVRGDILLVPAFLNLDSKGLDIEVLFLPVE